MRELNVNEIKLVSGGWWIVKALDWLGRASTAVDIANSWNNFSNDAKRMSGGTAAQHPIAAGAGKIDE